MLILLASGSQERTNGAFFPKRNKNPYPVKKGESKYENIMCTYCKKIGHTERVCQSRLRDENEINNNTPLVQMVSSGEMANGELMFLSHKLAGGKMDSEWYVDSGATQHMSGNANSSTI